MKIIDKFLLLYTFLLVSIQSFLLYSTKTIIFPEMYFFSWLVSKNFIPYKDFFDHHGFLLYYLFSPFIKNGNIENLKFVYIVILAINLIIGVTILKKTTKKIGVICGGILFICVNFYVGENILWYESVITTCFLLTYLLLISGNKKITYALCGICVGIATLIKPTVGVTILPLLLYRRKKEIAFGWFAVILSGGLFLWANDALLNFYKGVFEYNAFLVQSYKPLITIQWKFWIFSLIIIVLSIFILIKNKNIKYVFLSGIFFIGSLVSLKNGFGGERLILSATFLTLLIAQSLSSQKTKFEKIFVILCVIYICSIGIKSVQKYDELKNKRISWQENIETKTVINEIQTKVRKESTIYVLSNHGEYYMSIDTIPKTYYPLFFPNLMQFEKDLENKMINEIESNKPKYILLPKKADKEQLRMKKVQEWVKKNYQIDTDTKLYTLYK